MALKPQRSLVRKETIDLLEAAGDLDRAVAAAKTTASSPAMIENPKALHVHMRRLEDRLTQLRVLLNYR